MQTIPGLFLHLTETYKKPGLFLYKKDGRFVPLSTEMVRQEVERISFGLRSLGVVPGDKVILLAENGPWRCLQFPLRRPGAGGGCPPPKKNKGGGGKGRAAPPPPLRDNGPSR